MKIDKSKWGPYRLIDIFTKKEENDRENAQTRFDRFLKVDHMDAESLHIKRWSSQKEGEEINPTFYKIFRKGQILFPTRNPHLRRTVLASFDGICGEKTLTLEPNNELVVPEFIAFLFHSEKFYAHSTGAIIGSTNPHCRWRDVANYEFLLPPKAEQARLAELLWAMDEVIEAEKEVLTKLKTSYQAEIEKSVPKNHPDFFYLKEISKVRKGVTYKSEDYSNVTDGLPLLNLKSIEIGGGFNENGIKYYNGKYKEEHLVKNDDLVIACTDITREGNVVGFPLHPSVYQDKVMLFTMDLLAMEITSDKLIRDYLYYVLKSKWVHWRLFANSPGTTVLHLDINGLYKIRIPKFGIKEQYKIIEKLKEFESSISICQYNIQSSQSLQKTLINQLF